MCFAAYIGTNQKQTLTTWKQSETLLYLENLSKDDEVVKTKFSKSYVYYVGADTGCSCGFAWEVEYFNDPEEQERKKSPQKLIDFLRVLSEKESIEFYCCGEGDWDDPIIEKIELDIRNISLDKLYFMEEKQFVTFQRQSSD